jgi:RNA polymerase sigma-70 factor (ECF subfamily)
MKAANRSPGQESLEALLRQIRCGSLAAFDQFYERTAPFVMGLSVKMLGDRMEAEDVCHDVLMQVLSHPERYDPSRGSVEAWLAVLAKSRCIDRLRKRQRLMLENRKEGLSEYLADSFGDETEGRVLHKLQKEALREALFHLPEPQRQTLAAAFYQERSHRELAETWKVPVGTVKSRVRYGLSHLRRTMEKLGWALGRGGGNDA